MYKVNGLFSFPERRRLRELDFRAPEDRLSVDEGDEKEVRSPGIERMIKAYYDADHAGDDSEKATALRGMIDEMTALHKLRGVPVFAHPPLPPQFVTAQIDAAKYAGRDGNISKITDLIEPNNRPAVKMQLEGSLAMQSGPLADALSGRAPGVAVIKGLDERWARAGEPTDGYHPSEGADARGMGLRTLEYDPFRDAKDARWQPLPNWDPRETPPWRQVQQQISPYEAIQYVPPEQRPAFERAVEEGYRETANILGRVLYELSPLPQARQFVEDVRAGNYASAAVAILMVLPAFKGARIAHHIIARASRNHAELRAVMRSFGIDISDTDNLARMMGEVHHVLHTNNYYAYVERRMKSTRNADEMRAALRDIKDLLENLKHRDEARDFFPPVPRRR